MSIMIVRLRKQGTQPETLRFDKDEIYIGRLDQNDITLSMTNVSKKHAIAWIDNNTIYISDAGSTNGTYVNKRRISQPTPLTPDDEVYIGDFIFTIELEEDFDANPPSTESEHSFGGNPSTSGSSSRSVMPPPPRGTNPSQSYKIGGENSFSSVKNTQKSPAVTPGNPDLAATQTTDDLKDVFLNNDPSKPLEVYSDAEAAISTLDYDNKRPHSQRNTTGQHSTGADLNSTGNSFGEYGSSEIYNQNYSTPSDKNPSSELQPKNNNPPQSPSKRLSSSNRMDRFQPPSRQQNSNISSASPLQKKKLQPKDSGILNSNSRTAKPFIDVFKFPPEIEKLPEDVNAAAKEELFQKFLSSLEADGIYPHQISPLSEDLLHPYLDQLDTDNDTRQAFADEILRFGPITKILEDKSVSEIFINRYNQILVKSKTTTKYSNLNFHAPSSLVLAAKRLASIDSNDREVGPETYVDIRFQDDAIAIVSIPHDTETEPMIVIQRRGADSESLESMVKNEIMSENMATFLKRAIASGLNILIAGPLGTQKQVLLSSLSSLLPSSLRTIFISRGHRIKIPETGLTLHENHNNNSDVASMLVSAISLRPDRIILEQIKGDEAYTWVTSVSTSVNGSIASIAASSTQEALGNLLTLSMLASRIPSPYAIKEQIARSIDVVVILNNIGSKIRVVSIAEIDGVDIGSFRINDIFRFKMDDSFDGHFEATGYIPQVYEGFRQTGIEVDISIFRE